MEFIETVGFGKDIGNFLSHDEYMDFQSALLENPNIGKLIPGGHGLRKLRWAIKGKGKRGGLRVIYYYVVVDDIIYLMLVYKKADREDITKTQLKMLIDYLKIEGL